MCGIAGILAPGMPREEREAWVSGMLGRLAHRGPDGVALWSGSGVTLGITRLAIVATIQPPAVLAGDRGSVRAVVNGEIYNYRELTRALRERGHRVESAFDTALVVHEYEERGTDFTANLDGMFAIALWDEDARRLVLARDRAGEKPLFTCRAGDRFAFASEPGALIALPWVSRDPSPAALARYLVHGFFAGEDCAFASLGQLPPGGMLEVTEQEERASRYWRPWDALVARVQRAKRPGPEPAPMRDSELFDRTFDALERAVETRIPDEVPFGVFLSGGIDSSLVAALAARHTPGFPTFSMRMEAAGYDESEYARQVASHLGTRHYVVGMRESEGREALEEFVSTMDQPLGDPSVLPTWALARLASRHVPVVLTGEGGDELFAGYPTYLGHRHADLARAVPGWIRAGLLFGARRLRPPNQHISPAHAVERFLSALDLAPFERHTAWFGACAPDEASAFLSPDLRRHAGLPETLGHVTRIAAELRAADVIGAGDRLPLVAYQILDLSLYLGGGLVTKVDRCAMAHSVESRAPFLRRHLIEWALGLPDDVKLRGGEGKWILKRIADELLPPAIAKRRKQGFSPPFSSWVRGPMRAAVRDALTPDRVRRAGVLDPRAVTELLERHLSGRAEAGRALWTILSLQMWAENRSRVETIADRRAAAAVESVPARDAIGGPR